MSTAYPKTLIINPPHSNPFDRRTGPALGIAYIAAFLREKGYYVELFDANQKYIINNDEIINHVLEGGFDIVGISVMALDFYSTMDLAKKMKNKRSDIKIVIGGHHPTATHKEILREFPFIDIVVRGEGEVTFYELVRALEEKSPLEKILGISYREGGRIKINPLRALIKNLDEIPFPARDLLPSFEKYGLDEGDYVGRKRMLSIDIVTSRGCAHSCSFCSIPAYYSGYTEGRVRTRSAKNIVDEIEEMITNKDREYISICDDNFLRNIKMAIAITKEMKKRNISLRFLFTTRADQIVKNERYIPFLKENGFLWVELGVESGNDSVLKRFNKGTTVQENKQAIRILEDNDIGIIVDFIMFDPLVTIEELEENVNFLEGHDTFCHDPKNIYNQLDLFAGTLYGEWMRREGKWKDIHSPFSYKFEERNVSIVYKTLSKFAFKYQVRLDNLITEIMNLWAPVSPYLLNNKTKEMKKLEAELYIKPLELKRIPRSVLKKILTEGRKNGFDNINTGEIFKPFGDKIVKAENFVKNLRDDLRKKTKRTKELKCTI